MSRRERRPIDARTLARMAELVETGLGEEDEAFLKDIEAMSSDDDGAQQQGESKEGQRGGDQDSDASVKSADFGSADKDSDISSFTCSEDDSEWSSDDDNYKKSGGQKKKKKVSKAEQEARREVRREDKKKEVIGSGKSTATSSKQKKKQAATEEELLKESHRRRRVGAYASISQEERMRLALEHAQTSQSTLRAMEKRFADLAQGDAISALLNSNGKARRGRRVAGGATQKAMSTAATSGAAENVFLHSDPVEDGWDFHAMVAEQRSVNSHQPAAALLDLLGLKRPRRDTAFGNHTSSLGDASQADDDETTLQPCEQLTGFTQVVPSSHASNHIPLNNSVHEYPYRIYQLKRHQPS